MSRSFSITLTVPWKFVQVPSASWLRAVLRIKWECVAPAACSAVERCEVCRLWLAQMSIWIFPLIPSCHVLSTSSFRCTVDAEKLWSQAVKDMKRTRHLDLMVSSCSLSTLYATFFRPCSVSTVPPRGKKHVLELSTCFFQGFCNIHLVSAG